jgi:lactaldehyde reductase
VSITETILASQRPPTAVVGPDRIRFIADMRIGVDARLRVRELIGEIGGSRGFLLTGHHFADGSLGSELVETMGDAYAGTFVGETAQGSPLEVRLATEAVARSGADLLVAVGGGTVLGLAKCVAHALAEPDSFAPLTGSFQMEGEGPFRDPAGSRVPIISMPTNAGSGSEVNQYGAVMDSTTHRKVRVADYRLLPRIAVLDPVLTVSLDSVLTATTGANALSHCFEAIYSRARHPFSTGLALQAASLMSRALPLCAAEPDNLRAREDQLIASAMSSLAFSNSMLGLNSAFGHSFGLVGGIPVALGNYIMLPISLRRNAAHAAAEIVEVGVAMGLIAAGHEATPDAATEVANAIGGFLRSMAGEIRLRDLLPRPRLQEIASHMLHDVCLPYNPGPPAGYDTILQLLNQAW